MKKIRLNNSKSIQARILILQAIAAIDDSGFDFDCEGDCDFDCVCDDIDELYAALNSIVECSRSQQTQCADIFIEKSGTALRFILALCASTKGSYKISLGDRLSERPIKPLVDALVQLGADIQCDTADSLSILTVNGKTLQGGAVNIDASVSSQFISALMLIAPQMEQGIEINLKGKSVSNKYIHLTADIISKMGGKVYFLENKIVVPYFIVSNSEIDIEKCWSSATIWFALMAVLQCDDFLLEGLNLNSLHPDRAVVEQFAKLGVGAKQDNEGVILFYNKELSANKNVEIELKQSILEIDFNNNPDAVMAFAVAACLCAKPFRLSGVSTLKDKECDRAMALIAECRKCDFLLEMNGADDLVWNGEIVGDESEIPTTVCCYNDHRMAMVLALLQLRENIIIDSPEVVSKSYPYFWSELQKFF